MDMTCDRAGKLLKAWLDGELDPERAEGVAAHVAGCRACRCTAQDFREISRRLRAAPAGRSPVLDSSAIIERARDAGREEAACVLALKRVALMAAAVLLFAVSADLWSTTHGGRASEGDEPSAGIDSVLELAVSDPVWSYETE